MEFSTSINPIVFPDQGADATGVVPDGKEPISAKSIPTASLTAHQAEAANALPEAILSSWSRIAQANMSVPMYRSLVRLAMQPAGWRGPGSLGLRPGSLKSFLEFWLMIRNGAAEPELALAPDGSLHAEWFKSPRQRIDVRFLDNKVIFGLFAGNSILEGAEPRDTAAQILTTHPAKPLSWSGG